MATNPPKKHDKYPMMYPPGTVFDERGIPEGEPGIEWHENIKTNGKVNCEEPAWQNCWPDPVKAFEHTGETLQTLLPLNEPEKKKETCETLCRDRNAAIAQKCSNIRRHVALWLKEQGCPSIVTPARSAKGGCRPCGATKKKKAPTKKKTAAKRRR